MEHMIYTRDRHPDTHTYTQKTVQCRYIHTHTHAHNPKATEHKGNRGNGLANRQRKHPTSLLSIISLKMYAFVKYNFVSHLRRNVICSIQK